jgi:hypothetical protein
LGSERGKSGNGAAMASYRGYLELAQQAKSTGDEIAVQHNLQHAGHWYCIAMADRSETDTPAAPADGEILATN